MTPHRRKSYGRPERRAATDALQKLMKPGAPTSVNGRPNARAVVVVDDDPLSTPTQAKTVEAGRNKRIRSSEAKPSSSASSSPVKRVRIHEQEKTKDKTQTEAGPTIKSAHRTPTQKRRANVVMLLSADDELASEGASMIRPTSSDAYFVNHAAKTSRSARHQTSATLLTREVDNDISAKTIVDLTRRIVERAQNSMRLGADEEGEGTQVSPSIVSLHAFDRYHEQWWSLLTVTQRPLLFYGVGSKRVVLQRFARRMAREARCTVLVLRGEAGARPEEIVAELERGCGVIPATEVGRVKRATMASGLEARVEHLATVLTRQHAARLAGRDVGPLPPAYMLLVHNIDALTLLQEKSLRTIALLARAPNVHLCADTAHVNVAMLAGLDGRQAEGARLRWLWIDMTTYVPPLDDIIGEHGTGVGRTLGLPAVLDFRRAGAGGDVASAAFEAASMPFLSRSAAVSILKSVTDKARGLFLMLVKHLLDASNDKGQTSYGGDTLLSVPYDALAQMAREGFFATSPAALSAVLIEFTTHGLVSAAKNAPVRVALRPADARQVIDVFSSIESTTKETS